MAAGHAGRAGAPWPLAFVLAVTLSLLILVVTCPAEGGATAARGPVAAEELGEPVSSGPAMVWTGPASEGLVAACCSEEGAVWLLAKGPDRVCWAASTEVQVLPLPFGEGAYTLKAVAAEPVDGGRPVLATFEVEAGGQTYLRSSSRVPSVAGTEAGSAAASLASVAVDEADLAGALCSLVTERVSYLAYDYVMRSYVADPAGVWERGQGMCLDRSTLLCSMCRETGIPARVVIGFTDEGECHAWVEVLCDGEPDGSWDAGDGWRGLDPSGGDGQGWTVSQRY